MFRVWRVVRRKGSGRKRHPMRTPLSAAQQEPGSAMPQIEAEEVGGSLERDMQSVEEIAALPLRHADAVAGRESRGEEGDETDEEGPGQLCKERMLPDRLRLVSCAEEEDSQADGEPEQDNRRRTLRCSRESR